MREAAQGYYPMPPSKRKMNIISVTAPVCRPENRIYEER